MIGKEKEIHADAISVPEVVIVVVIISSNVMRLETTTHNFIKNATLQSS